ncbi:hypothetical protein ABRP72_06005 [Pectobacterium carotovorum]|uniref:hypothetical protein n=1 Tax=Pectobacterium carotovorum TaxID=554 RepID=UPI0032EBEC1B
MVKSLNTLLLVSLLSACSQSPASIDKNALVGTWAMLPLKNGIANVVEFRADGKALLHVFNCEKPNVDEGVETSDYVVDVHEKLLHLTASGNNNTLKIMDLKSRAMKMEQAVMDEKLTFSYVKVDKVMPLCFLYTPKDRSRETAFQKSDFIPAPEIPDHKDLANYIGKWLNNGVTQLEIRQGKNGQIYLYMPANENWHHLYNNAHWENDALSFNSYAYSEKPSLFSHPYHKSLTPNTIRLLPNGKMHVTVLMIDGEKIYFDFTRG